MHWNRFVIPVLVLLMATSAIAQVGRPYVFSKVADDNSGFSSFSSPVINNNGQVAFPAVVGGNLPYLGIFHGATPASAYVTQADGFDSFADAAINDAGSIVFSGRLPNFGDQGVFTSPSPSSNIAAGRGFIGVGNPELNSAGTVSYNGSFGVYSYNPLRNHDAVTVGQVAGSSSIFAENTRSGPNTTFRRIEPTSPIVTDNGATFFVAQEWDSTANGYKTGIYNGPTPASAVVQSNQIGLDGLLDVNNTGSLAFSGAFADANNTVYRGVFRGPDPSDAVVLEDDLFIRIMSVDINNAGTIAFNSQLGGASGASGIYTGADHLNDRVVGPGDNIFGVTVRDAFMERGGLNDKGQIVFHYITPDLHSGIGLASLAGFGDADGNGVVNFDDYARIDNGFNNHLTGWRNGDFDGNGVIDFDDYSLIDNAFNAQNGGGAGTQPVPEPTTVLGAALAFVACLGRRRRR